MKLDLYILSEYNFDLILRHFAGSDLHSLGENLIEMICCTSSPIHWKSFVENRSILQGKHTLQKEL